METLIIQSPSRATGTKVWFPLSKLTSNSYQLKCLESAKTRLATISLQSCKTCLPSARRLSGWSRRPSQSQLPTRRPRESKVFQLPEWLSRSGPLSWTQKHQLCTKMLRQRPILRRQTPQLSKEVKAIRPTPTTSTTQKRICLTAKDRAATTKANPRRFI